MSVTYTYKGIDFEMILPDHESARFYYSVFFKEDGKTYGVRVKEKGFEKTGIDMNNNFEVLRFIVDFGGVFDKFGVIK